MKLHDLHPAPGSHKPPRRVGRGHGSGRGKTAGRGTKGQKSRSGASIPAWFEGGQTPLHVRTPKLHGFKNRARIEFQPVNLARLGSAEAGTLVTPDVLKHAGVLADTKRPVKILGVGEAPKGITVHAHAFSRTAVEKLEAAGSTVQQLSWPGNLPVEESQETEAEAAVSPDAEASAEAEGSTEEEPSGEPELAEQAETAESEAES
jgi:large subunit ribosomal protein L15